MASRPAPLHQAAAPAAASTKYHRFRGGERCDECGARQWYAENAIRYCRNGHRLEGFAAHDADEDAFGTLGRVSRRKRGGDDGDGEEGGSGADGSGGGSGARKRRGAGPGVKLSGRRAAELYLEVLQLVLRRQVRAVRRLVTVSAGGERAGGGGGGHGVGGVAQPSQNQSQSQSQSQIPRPDSEEYNEEEEKKQQEDKNDDDDDDFERIVRSLWALRVRNALPPKAGAADSGADSDGESMSVGGGSSLFAGSSASEPGSESDLASQSSAVTTTTAGGGGGGLRKLPGLVDALALCYLGCLVKRLPVTTADLHGWAQRGEVEFLAAVSC